MSKRPTTDTTKPITWAALVAWVAALPPELINDPRVNQRHKRTPAQAAQWYMAWRAADGFQDLRQKDFAQLLLDGSKPLTARACARELASLEREWQGYDSIETERAAFWDDAVDFWFEGETEEEDDE